MPRHRWSRAAFGSLLLIVLPLVAHAGNNRWTTQGPFGADVQVLLALADGDRTVLRAGTLGGGVWTSTDRAATWTPANGGIEGTRVLDLVAHPGNPEVLYAVTELSGVWKSTNGGRAWSDAGDGLPRGGGALPGDEGTAPTVLAIDPSAPARLWAGTRGAGVFRSTNAGQAWQASNDGLDNLTVSALAVDPSDPATVWAGTADGLRKSGDRGLSWSDPGVAALAGHEIRQVVVDPANSTTIYAVAAQGAARQLFKSTDGGASFTRLDFGGPNSVNRLVLDPGDPGVLLVLTDSRVFRSSNGGVSWLAARSAGLPAAPLPAFAADPLRSGTLWVGSGDGVFRSSNTAGSFAAVNQGLAALDVFDVAADPEQPSRIWAASGRGLFRSTDTGRRWERIDFGPSGPDNFASVEIDPSDPATVYAGAGGTQVAADDGLYRSRNRGASWELVSQPGLGTVQDLAIDAGSSATLYALTSGRGLARSDDGGATWTPISDGLPGFPIKLAASPSQAGKLYAATIDFGFNSRIVTSDDGGESWRSLASSPNLLIVLSLVVDPSDPATVWAGGISLSTAGLARTTDGGASWTSLRSGVSLAAVSALAIDPSSPSTVYADGLLAVLKSTDGGDTWSQLGGRLVHAVRAVEVSPADPRRLFLATAGGSVFDLLQAEDDEPDDEEPDDEPDDEEPDDEPEPTEPCTSDATTLCIDDRPGDGRFEVTVEFETELDGGSEGDASAASLAELGIRRGGILSFFDPANPEILVKVLDGCGLNDRFWVFYAATTTVGFDLRVTDTLTGRVKTYSNPDRTPAAPVTDTGAFATCDVRSEGTVRTPPPVVEKGGTCAPGTNVLCIDDQPGDARFRITAAFETSQGGGSSGDAAAVSLAPLGIRRGGVFSFFDPTNPEILVKVLDGCGLNGHFWVFSAATTTVGFTLDIEDTRTGERRVLRNPDGSAAVPVADIEAFATCEP